MKLSALIIIAAFTAPFAWSQQPGLRDLSCSAAGASGTTYTCSIPVAPVAYLSGQQYRFKADVANTGAATINLNGLGAVAIKKIPGGITTALVANDIGAGQWVYLTYDGTNMQMASQLGNAGSGGGGISQIVVSSPLTGGTITSTGTIGCPTASGSQAGCLSASDWTTFNAKQSSLSLPLSIANGGTGTASPGLVQGTNITITGSWPNQTVTASSTASTAFSALTGSTNTTAAMMVGTGASLGATGSGTITATSVPGGGVTGSNSIPASTLPLATTAAFGAVKCDGTTTTCASGVISAVGGGGGGFYQTFQSNGTAVAQRAMFNMVAGTNITITPTDNGSNLTTFTVNATSGGSTFRSSGTLSGLPATCTPGTGIYEYFATDQPAGQQLYQCSSTNVFTQIVNLGGSGALAYTAGSLDVTSAVPLKSLANTYTANQSEGLGAKWATTHGSNATAGVVTLSSGTVTISTTSVATLATSGGSGDVITLTQQTCSSCGSLSIGSVSNGVSFVINSTNSSDASQVYWEIRHLN